MHNQAFTAKISCIPSNLWGAVGLACALPDAAAGYLLIRMGVRGRAVPAHLDSSCSADSGGAILGVRCIGRWVLGGDCNRTVPGRRNCRLEQRQDHARHGCRDGVPAANPLRRLYPAGGSVGFCSCGGCIAGAPKEKERPARNMRESNKSIGNLG